MYALRCSLAVDFCPAYTHMYAHPLEHARVLVMWGVHSASWVTRTSSSRTAYAGLNSRLGISMPRPPLAHANRWQATLSATSLPPVGMVRHIAAPSSLACGLYARAPWYRCASSTAAGPSPTAVRSSGSQTAVSDVVGTAAGGAETGTQLPIRDGSFAQVRIFMGPMCSGKTSRLLQCVNEARSTGSALTLVKHAIDTRHAGRLVTARTGWSLAADVQAASLDAVHVVRGVIIAVDEAQVSFLNSRSHPHAALSTHAASCFAPVP